MHLTLHALYIIIVFLKDHRGHLSASVHAAYSKLIFLLYHIFQFLTKFFLTLSTLDSLFLTIECLRFRIALAQST